MIKFKKFCSDNIGITFVLPAFVFYTVFFVIAIMVTFYFSLFEWNGVGFHTMKFIGLGNYLEIFGDKDFWNAIKNNIIWLILSCTVPIALSLVIAIMLSSKMVKGKTFFRTVYFIPLVLSLPAVGQIWYFVYNPTRGLIVNIIRSLGSSDAVFTWMGDPNLVLIAVFIASSWASFGFYLVIFVAALQGVDPAYYEYALIEGANWFQRTIYITIPMISAVFSMAVLNAAINSFKVFDIIWVMTGGGPYRSSEVAAVYMYNQTFRHLRTGYGSTIGIMYTIIIGIFVIIYLRLTRKEDSL